MCMLSENRPALEMLTTQEVARFLSVTPHTIRRWIQEGRLTPDFKTLGGHFRFDRKHVEALRNNPVMYNQ